MSINPEMLEQSIKNAGDVGSAGVLIAALVGWLPSIAAGVAILWGGIRLYEYFRWVRRGRPPREKP